jgi:hypothetical protein
MAQGTVPGSSGLTSTVVNPGTLALTDTPLPGSVGLDTGGGGQGSAGLGDKVAAQAKQRAGQRVGDGECFALADQSLKAAGAQSAEDFGTITPDADYSWGTQATISDVRAGDVIQFRNYRYDRKITVTAADGSTSWREDSQERPHHTAVVESVGSDGAVTVLEQNAPKGSATHRTTLFFKDIDSTVGSTNTKITVQGKFWIYHPQKK